MLRMMSPLALNHRWVFDMKILTLLYGVLLQNNQCDTLDTQQSSRLKDMLVISAESITTRAAFPSDVIYHNSNGVKLCFNILENRDNAGCCTDFSCNVKINRLSHDQYNLTLNIMTLSNHDVVVLLNPTHNFSCMPSLFYNSTGLILNLHNCLKRGGNNIRLSQDGLCGQNLSSEIQTCEETGQTNLQFQINIRAKTCKILPCELPTTTVHTTITTGPTTTQQMTTNELTITTEPITTQQMTTNELTITTEPTTTQQMTTNELTITTGPTTTQQTTTTMPTLTLNYSKTPVNQEDAAQIMGELDSLLDKMGNSSKASIKIGNITGVIAKLPPQNQTNMNFHFTASGQVNALNENGETDFYRNILIPTEASEMAVKRNGSYAGVLLFPGMLQDNPNGFFYNNEILGIEMGAKISNLSETIDIYYSSVNTSGSNASCRSWDGKVNSSWTTDGCQTVETNSSIQCRCSHLTFFAILMSPAPTNISTSVYKTLTKITEIGCGVSMVFLGVALFMHFLIRKTKVTNAAKILVNLFIAMFALNFSFLINKTIADLNNPAGCVAMAAFLHYSMLATFTWFTMQALHLYFSLRKLPADVKHYVYKIYATGWITPAVVTIALLALKKYGNIVIHVDEGSSANMCWIPDSAVHLGVNVGYYAVVFVFTFFIFIVTVKQMVHLESKAGKVQDSSSTKKKFFSILGLFCLLGISWGFAFFSFGPLLIPSYYIFTILNSFQGLLLFIYYFYSTKITAETRKVSQSTTSTVTENQNNSS